MSTELLPFPDHCPSTYRPLVQEPSFEPQRHLALEPPKDIWRLVDLGYSDHTISDCATDVAIAGPFRLLSDEGVTALREVALALREERTSSHRTASFVTGGVYRSAFVRGLCQSPDVAAFLSLLCNTQIAPHSIPSQQAYINYAPDNTMRAVDPWHVDSIGLDSVLMVSDPTKFDGGEFQFFQGTIHEAASLFGTTTDRLPKGHLEGLPQDRIETLPFPGPGYAIFQQGHLVVHRATRLTRPAERITLVTGYIPCDIRYRDATNIIEIATWAEPGLLSELARHSAWLACAKLRQLITDPPKVDDPRAISEALSGTVADIERTLQSIRNLSAKL